MWALLFDLDGTLALTNAIHEQAWRDVLGKHDVNLSAQGFREGISGRGNPEIVENFLPTLPGAAAREVIDAKEALFRQRASRVSAPDGLVDLVRWAVSERCQLAVVTNAPRENAHHVLHVLGVASHFRLVVGAEDVTQAKPAPEPYLVAARQLGVAVSRCFAFEDSPSGVRAAVAAGMAVAGLCTGHTVSELTDAGADPVVADFADLGLQGVLRAFARAD